MLSEFKQEQIVKLLLKHKYNYKCADCNSLSPTWASLSFGVFICSNCAGAHRGLGPIITRVKSTNLDQWKQKDFQNMRIGNEVVNEYWQAKLKNYNKPKTFSSLEQINKYVVLKYIKKRFAKEGLDPVHQRKKQQQISLKINHFQKVQPKQVENPKQVERPKLTQDLITFQQDQIPNIKSSSKQVVKSQTGTTEVQNQKLFTFNDLLNQTNRKYKDCQIHFYHPKDAYNYYNKQKYNSLNNYYSGGIHHYLIRDKKQEKISQQPFQREYLNEKYKNIALDEPKVKQQRSKTPKSWVQQWK